MNNINIITSLVRDNCCVCLNDRDIQYKCITCHQAKLCKSCYLKINAIIQL